MSCTWISCQYAAKYFLLQEPGSLDVYKKVHEAIVILLGLHAIIHISLKEVNIDVTNIDVTACMPASKAPSTLPVTEYLIREWIK